MGFQPRHKKFGGRKLGSKNKSYSREAIEKAIENAKTKHDGISLLEHLCDLAYTDEKVAIALLRKLAPDLKSVELQIDSLEKPDPFAGAQYCQDCVMRYRMTMGYDPEHPDGHYQSTDVSRVLREILREIEPGHLLVMIKDEKGIEFDEAVSTAMCKAETESMSRARKESSAGLLPSAESNTIEDNMTEQPTSEQSTAEDK